MFWLNGKKYIPILISVCSVFLLNLGVVDRINAQDLRRLEEVGRWQYHMPMRLATHITQSSSAVYCGAVAGLFSFDRETNSITRYTKQDGFSGLEISSINFNTDVGILVIAYKDGNIDLFREEDQQIINLNDIQRKQIAGSKEIYQITFDGSLAYLATNFGVVVLDLEKFEIKETYRSLDTDGGQLIVYGIAIRNSTIYLGTEKGVLYGTLSNQINLLDFNNWNRYDSDTLLPDLPCTAIGNYNEGVVAYFYDTTQYNTYRLLSDDSWELLGEISGDVQSLDKGISGSNLLITTSDTIYQLDENSTISVLPVEASFFRETIQSAEDEYWIAENSRGMYHILNGTEEIIKPNSPSNSSVFSLAYINENIYALKGGYNNSYGQFEADFFIDYLDDYQWGAKNYSFDTGATLYGVKDVVKAIQNSENDIVYYACYGYGLIEEYEPEKFRIYNDQNSPLVNALDTGAFVRITDIDFDSNHDLWIANYNVPGTEDPLHVFRNNGTWESFNFPGISGSAFPEKLLVDKNDQKWIVPTGKRGGGIILLDSSNTKFRYLTNVFEEGLLPNKEVKSIAEDLEGAIWVGTTNGVAIFGVPDQMFEEGVDNDAQTPIVDGRPLLESETVTCIEVDAGNRKWVGTPNGIWLFDPDGLSVIQNFTESNSPLISNNIIDIEIHPETGEVFIATDRGLVSYRGDATEGLAECSDEVQVFPNPVRPDFDGLVAVSGLRKNAGIKITDISGNLVNETDANGGTAVWNRKDVYGEPVSSGVYQILVIGANHKTSCITRVAVVN